MYGVLAVEHLGVVVLVPVVVVALLYRRWHLVFPRGPERSPLQAVGDEALVLLMPIELDQRMTNFVCLQSDWLAVQDAAVSKSSRPELL
jgi:hypothetical protein